MPEQQATTVQQTAVPASAARMPTVPETAPAIAEPALEDEWDEPIEELPPRPRRRLLAPVPLALLGVLLIACGFIAGVLVEKGQTSSSSSGAAGGERPRLALRGAAWRRLRHARRAAGAARRRWLRRGRVAAPAGARPSARSRTSPDSTLYVTNAEGNTVKVDDLARRDRDQDRQSQRQGHPPRRNRDRHGRRGRRRSAQRRIDPRRRCRRRPRRAVRRRGRRRTRWGWQQRWRRGQWRRLIRRRRTGPVRQRRLTRSGRIQRHH